MHQRVNRRSDRSRGRPAFPRRSTSRSSRRLCRTRRMARFWCATSSCRWIPRCAVGSTVADYSEPVALGAVMRSGAVGRVEESRSADFHAGDCGLDCSAGTTSLSWPPRRSSARSTARVCRSPHRLRPRPRWSDGLFRLAQVGQPRAGETVVVSTAAGAVGSASAKSPRSRVRYRRHCRWARQGAYVSRGLFTTLRWITRLTISRQHSMSPAQKALTSTSTTRPAQSAIPSWTSQCRSTGGHLRHGIHREPGPATTGTAGRTSSSRQTRANAGLSDL